MEVHHHTLSFCREREIQLAYTFSSFFDTFFTPSVTVLLATPLVLLYGPHVLTTLSLASSSVRTGKFAWAKSIAAFSRRFSFILAILLRTIFRQ